MRQKRHGSAPKAVAPHLLPSGAAYPRRVPRRPRNLYDGIYHLAAHGSDSRYLFVSDRDREDFLDRLSTIWQKFELALLS